MKKLMVLAVAICLLSLVGVSFAEETSGATYSGSSAFLVNVNNNLAECGKIDHSHLYNDADTVMDPALNFSYGAGLNVIFYEAVAQRMGLKKAIPDTVAIETKYDVPNEHGSAFLVATYKISDFLAKK